MDATTSATPMKALVVVIERDIVIANDLCEMLQDHDPDAQVTACRTLAEARETILQNPNIKVVLTNLSPADLARVGLEILVFSRGGHIVVLSGTEAADLSSDSRWIFAQRVLSPPLLASIMRKVEKRGPPDKGG